jgi:hypothetical protein
MGHCNETDFSIFFFRLTCFPYNHSCSLFSPTCSLYKYSCSLNSPFCLLYNLIFLISCLIWSHCTDKMPKIGNIFLFWEKRGLSPNIHIHVSENNLYISTISLSILPEKLCGPILGLYNSLRYTCKWILGLRPRYSHKRNT